MPSGSVECEHLFCRAETTNLEHGSRILLSSFLDGAEVGGQLPALRLRQAGPGGHSVAEVTLPQEPFDVAIAGVAQLWAAQRGTLVPVTLGVGLVALLAVVAIDKSAGMDRLCLASQWIDARMVLGRNVFPMRC